MINPFAKGLNKNINASTATTTQTQPAKPINNPFGQTSPVIFQSNINNLNTVSSINTSNYYNIPGSPSLAPPPINSPPPTNSQPVFNTALPSYQAISQIPMFTPTTQAPSQSVPQPDSKNSNLAFSNPNINSVNSQEKSKISSPSQKQQNNTPLVNHKQYVRYTIKQITSNYESDVSSRLDYDKRVKNSSLPRANEFPKVPAIVLPSTNYIYNDEYAIQYSKFPICIYIQPFINNNIEYPILDYRGKEIPRCKSCGSFFNPYQVQAVNGSICNLCGVTSDMGYFQYENDYIYDIEVDAKYCEINEEIERVTLYIYENTISNKNNYILNYFLEHLQTLETPFIIIIVDQHTHLIGIKNGVLFEHACPLLDSLGAYPLSEYVITPNELIIKSIVNFIPTLNPVAYTQIIPLISFMVDDVILDSKLHMIAIVSEYQEIKENANEILLFTPTSFLVSDVRSKLVESLEHYQEKDVRFDLFCITNYGENIELKELGLLCTMTGGSLFFYQQPNVLNLHYDLFNLLNNDIYFNGALRVRASKGMEIIGVEGTGFPLRQVKNQRGVPSFTSDTCFLINLKIKDEIKKEFTSTGLTYYQISLLYSTDKRYFIRIINHCLPITDEISHVYNSANEPLVIKYIFSEAARELMKNGLQSARDYIQFYITDLLAFYRQRCMPSAKPGQLIVPDGLRSILYYLQAILKNPLFQKTSSPTLRTYNYFKIRNLPLNQMALNIAGYLLRTDNFVSFDDLPPSLCLSASSIDLDGCYVLYTNQMLYYLIGKEMPKDLVEVLKEKLEEQQTIELESNDLTQFFDAAIYFSRELSVPVTLVKWGSPLETIFFSKLIEDRVDVTGSYNDFICQIHAKIQEKLA